MQELDVVIDKVDDLATTQDLRYVHTLLREARRKLVEMRHPDTA